MTVKPISPVRVVPVASVIPYETNPRRIPDKAVEMCAASIKEFGWQQPLVVDKDMVLVAGHVRLLAAQQLGLTEVPVVIAEHLSPLQVKAFRIADNRTHDYASWDYTLLAQELEGLDENFADVLDLADWQDIVSQYESARNESQIPFDDGALGYINNLEFNLTVSFNSREAADKAAVDLLDIPGVVNVAYSWK